MSDKKNPSLPQGSDSSGKSTANTRFSTNQKSNLGRKLVQELVDSGIPIDLQYLLNYKYVNKEEAFQLMGYRWSGWVVLYTDLDGKPYTHNGKPFYRIKPDAGQLTGYKPPKYLSAKGSGCRPYYSPLLKFQDLIKNLKGSGDVIITEGEKKADSLVINGFTTIGLAGVDCWRDGRSTEMLPELEAINWRGRNVFIVFDSDVTSKDSVQRALKDLACKLTEKGARVRVATLPCDLDGTKNGADDFLVKYGREALIQLLGKARDSHKNRRYIWKDEPEKSHHIAVTASVVFKNLYALRPAIGLYKWVGTRWEHSNRKPKDAIITPLHEWLDHMNWEKRENHHLASITSELLARIEHPEWDSNHLMSFKNGTFNNKNQEFYRWHDRKHYLTHSFNFNYSENAKCPTWLRFLNESFSNNQEKIELLKAAFKWSISPKDNQRAFLLELIFDLYGRRGSGKGTTLEVLIAVAGGKESYGILKASSLKPTELFPLIGKKIAYDPDSSGLINQVGKFNSIISNEPVLVKQLFFNESFERLGVVCWRAFNDNPTASGGGVEGLGRRMVTFKFDKTAANPDPELKNKLLAEIEGIFWWCWSMDDNKMFDVLKNRGNVESVAEATIENLLENQPVLQFIYELNGLNKTKSSNLYSKYRDWCKESGRHEMTITRFGKELKKMEGFVQKDIKADGNYYTIKESAEINLAEHFGISTNGRLNHQSLKVDDSNPPASNPPINKGKNKSMESMDSSNNKNSFKNKNNNLNKKEEKQITLQTLQPSITGSAWDTASDDDDPYWNE